MNSARHMALHASPMNHFYLHKIQKMFCFCGCPLTNYYGENGAIVSTVGGGTPTSQGSGTRCTPVVPHGRPPPPLAAGRLGGGTHLGAYPPRAHFAPAALGNSRAESPGLGGAVLAAGFIRGGRASIGRPLLLASLVVLRRGHTNFPRHSEKTQTCGQNA